VGCQHSSSAEFPPQPAPAPRIFLPWPDVMSHGNPRLSSLGSIANSRLDLELLQHRFGGTDLDLARRFDTEIGNGAIFDDHAKTFRPATHAKTTGI
jgi:hypothetical protein